MEYIITYSIDDKEFESILNNYDIDYACCDIEWLETYI